MTNTNEIFEHIVFGERVTSRQPLSCDMLRELISKGRETLLNGHGHTQNKIWELFERLSRALADNNYPHRISMFQSLLPTYGLSIAEATMNYIPELFSPDTLIPRFEFELGNKSILDYWTEGVIPDMRLIMRPLGLLLHVAPNDVFKGPVESLIDGILTRNINFIKTSNSGPTPVLHFARAILDLDHDNIVSKRLCVLNWKSGDPTVENILKKEMDRILVWGSKADIDNWHVGLGQNTSITTHGPKISLGIISQSGLKSLKDLNLLTDAIAFDISLWDQKGCSCPQVLYVESFDDSDLGIRFLKSLAESLQRLAVKFPTYRFTKEERFEVQRYRQAMLDEKVINARAIELIYPNSTDWTIVIDRATDGELEASPLNRTILIKSFSSLNRLRNLLKAHSLSLQTVGSCLSSNEFTAYADCLADVGVTRICQFGRMAITKPGAPHDGRSLLRDLTRTITLETS